MHRAFEHRERILDVAEAAPATTWLEAAEALLDQQSAQARSDLSGTFTDRSEARRQLRAIRTIKDALKAEKSIPAKKFPHEKSDDPLIRRMRRADLLCFKGWREGIRQKLLELADIAERSFLDAKVANDDDIVLSLALRAFVGELDWVATRGATARATFTRKSMKEAS
jgi:hypothetical protein